LAAPFGWRCLTGPAVSLVRVLRAQPLTQPLPGLLVHRPVRPADRSQREVVRPAHKQAVEFAHLLRDRRPRTPFQELPGSSPISRPSPLPALPFNQGPFPPPPLRGFIGTTGLSAARRGPEASLAGLRSAVTRGRRYGLPVFTPAPSFRPAAAPTPAGPRGPGRSQPRAASAFPEEQAGRLLRCMFRGLLGVHSRCGRPARGVPWGPFPPKASTASLPPPPLRLLPAGATQLPGGFRTR